MDQAVITRRSGGEYSTVILPNGIVETCWFDNNGESQVIGRTVPKPVAAIAEEHIAAWES